MNMEPSAAFDQDIHQRLLAGEPTAPSELVVAYLEPLTRWLQSSFHNIHDEHIIIDAVTDTLLNYIEHPSRFDPVKSRLLHYVKMSARRDLLNALQKERRRAQRHTVTDPVELCMRSGNVSQEDEEKAAAVEHTVQEIFAVVSDPRDRALLQLLLAGERKTTVYAAILGLQDHDEVSQRRIVKRHKDRLKKRLERSGVTRREQSC